MTTFHNSPRMISGDVVLLDPASRQIVRVMFQCNSDTLTRKLQPQAIAGVGQDRWEPPRHRRTRRPAHEVSCGELTVPGGPSA